MRIENAHKAWGSEVSIHVTAPKKATNLSLSVDVLAEARRLGINVSHACDEFLRDLVRTERARRWREENSEFIAVYNRQVESDGLPLAEWRNF